LIEVKSLTRYYGSHPAVTDVSFTIADNEIVGILGLNGAGKSTTLKVLAGLLMPTAGQVCIDSVDMLDAPDSFRKQIGFLPEEPPLYVEMRVSDYLSWVGEVKGLSKAQVETRLPEVIKLCQIESVANQVIETLSHGFRKRVGIAQAIIHNPKFVILDEPISGLDPAQIVEIRQVITGLKAHCTVMISSHILSEVSQTCDRILVLHDGRIVAEGTESELAAQLAATQHVEVTVKGDKAAFENHLSTQEFIESYTMTTSTTPYASAEVILRDDNREALISTLVHSGFGIRALQTGSSELEATFLSLTETASTRDAGGEA
jgi:ABC-2 type transport system ATP-binding protein